MVVYAFHRRLHLTALSESALYSLQDLLDLNRLVPHASRMFVFPVVNEALRNEQNDSSPPTLSTLCDLNESRSSF